MISIKNSLIKNTIIYFIGNTLSKIISFVLLPIYTKYINPSEYGLYDITTVYINLILAVLYLDLGSTILRFMFTYDNDDKYFPISNGFFLYLISSILFAIILFSYLILKKIFTFKYFILLYFFGISSILNQYYGFIARGLGKSKLFILTGFISTLMNALLNILFIVVLKKGYSYLFLSICISNIIQILIVEIVVKCLNNISLKYIKIRLIKEIVKFSLPLGFNMICVWFLSSFNKLVIQKYIGIYYNGIYAISTKFGLAISLLANSFLLAWQENAFAKKGNKEEKRKYFDSRINLVIELLGYLTALIIPIVFIIFPIFIDVQYFEAKKYVPLYLIIMIIASFNTFLGSIFSNMFLTKKLFLSTFLGALLNIVICIPLVKMYKLNGANISLLGGYLFSILMRLIYLSNELGVKVNTKKAIIAIMLSAIGYTIYLSNNIYVNIAYILAITIILIKKKYFRYYLRSN